jgi:hypothetical protein
MVRSGEAEPGQVRRSLVTLRTAKQGKSGWHVTGGCKSMMHTSFVRIASAGTAGVVTRVIICGLCVRSRQSRRRRRSRCDRIRKGSGGWKRSGEGQNEPVRIFRTQRGEVMLRPVWLRLAGPGSAGPGGAGRGAGFGNARQGTAGGFLTESHRLSPFEREGRCGLAQPGKASRSRVQLGAVVRGGVTQGFVWLGSAMQGKVQPVAF